MIEKNYNPLLNANETLPCKVIPTDLRASYLAKPSVSSQPNMSNKDMQFLLRLAEVCVAQTDTQTG